MASHWWGIVANQQGSQEGDGIVSPVDVAILYCECLSAITSYHSNTLQSLVPDISQLLRTIVKSEDANRDKLIVCNSLLHCAETTALVVYISHRQ